MRLMLFDIKYNKYIWKKLKKNQVVKNFALLK